jgi:hypothetical protein
MRSPFAWHHKIPDPELHKNWQIYLSAQQNTQKEVVPGFEPGYQKMRNMMLVKI